LLNVAARERPLSEPARKALRAVVEEDGAVPARLLGRVQEEPHQKGGEPETADGGPLLRADAPLPRGPAGGQVHPLAGGRRRGGDGEDQGAADGARTGGAPQPSRKHGTFHLSRGLIGAARVSDLSGRGSQIVAPVLLLPMLPCNVSKKARIRFAPPGLSGAIIVSSETFPRRAPIRPALFASSAPSARAATAAPIRSSFELLLRPYPPIVCGTGCNPRAIAPERESTRDPKAGSTRPASTTDDVCPDPRTEAPERWTG